MPRTLRKRAVLPPPLEEDGPPPEAPRPATPTPEELRQSELDTDRRMAAAKASFVEQRHAREEREMRESMEAIQAGYEDTQRRAMAQRDAEMAKMRARYARTQQQGNAEFQIYSANMAKVTAPKAPATLPANRKLPEYVVDPTRPNHLPNRDHNAPITAASVATMPRGDRNWVPSI